MNGYSLEKPEGFIEIAENVYVSVMKKPKWFHMFMMRILLGWRWRKEIL